MKNKTNIRLINCILVVCLTVAVLAKMPNTEIKVVATTIEGLQGQIKDSQGELNKWTEELADLEDAQDLIEEKLEDLNAEIINMMTSIGVKEEEIAQKEEEIGRKENEISLTQGEYEAAKRKEEEQYEAMINRMLYMYENGNSSLFDYFVGSTDFGDLLNSKEYSEKVIEYDNKVMAMYAESKEVVHEWWVKLEGEKEDLEADRIQLEHDREYLEGQKAELDVNLAKLKRESANYDSLIARARQEAAAAKKKLQQEQEQLRKLEEERRRANANAARGNYSVSAQQFDVSIIDRASGSDLGKRIAKYACQFIGNPYVAGGTSLTRGADCSGFTYRVFYDFGYNLPRTSYEQRSVGRGVSYDQAQPGDIICYEGHVGIYVGGGYIVHASTAKTGIKISKATYRSIVGVRRII